MKNVSEKPFTKDFRIMVIGQIISIVGSSLLRFILALYVLDLTGRADIFAMLYAISSIPLLLAPLGGALADRFNRRNLMVILDIANSLVVFGFFFLLLTNYISIIFIGIFMFLLAVISTLYAPLVMASIPLLVQEEKLETANGIVHGIQALSNIAAPVLGGVLYGIVGLKVIVVVSGIAFFLSAILELFIQIPFTKRKQEGRIVPTIVKDIRYGFSYVMKQSYIFKSMILAALLNLILTPLFLVGAPVILRITLQSNDVIYGVGMAFIDFSTILGALSIGFFAKKMSMKKLYQWIFWSALLMIPMALSITPVILRFGYYSSFLLYILSSILIATMMTMISIFVISAVQKKTPNENLGKVMAIIMMVSQCMAPIGQILYGSLFELFNGNLYVPILFVSVLLIGIASMTKRMLRNEEGTV